MLALSLQRRHDFSMEITYVGVLKHKQTSKHLPKTHATCCIYTRHKTLDVVEVQRICLREKNVKRGRKAMEGCARERSKRWRLIELMSLVNHIFADIQTMLTRTAYFAKYTKWIWLNKQIVMGNVMLIATHVDVCIYNVCVCMCSTFGQPNKLNSCNLAFGLCISFVSGSVSSFI